MLTAIIPARGGSKGVVGKNMRQIGGRTLVAIAIEKCREIADRVIVSSDCAKILVEASVSRAEIVKRPWTLASDEATTWDALRHACDVKEIDSGDILLHQCTAPLVSVEDLERCVSHHRRGDADLSVLCHHFHGLVLDAYGTCINRRLIPAPRRQDMIDQWIVSGSGWAFDVGYLDRELYSGRVRPVESFGHHCDIDTEDDLNAARLLLDTSPLWMQS